MQLMFAPVSINALATTLDLQKVISIKLSFKSVEKQGLTFISVGLDKEIPLTLLGENSYWLNVFCRLHSLVL